MIQGIDGQSSIMASFILMQTAEAFLLAWWTKVDSCFIRKFCNYGYECKANNIKRKGDIYLQN
ncbi:hypothetical protein GYH30_033249 [Glycine max]|nr:hypothetical protein GYH30_033249 [Glycine max]